MMILTVEKLGWYEMGKKAECKVSMMGDFLKICLILMK